MATRSLTVSSDSFEQEPNMTTKVSLHLSRSAILPGSKSRDGKTKYVPASSEEHQFAGEAGEIVFPRITPSADFVETTSYLLRIGGDEYEIWMPDRDITLADLPDITVAEG